MQREAVERRLLTCQEMFQEIEQKVTSLSADQLHQRQDELGALGSRQDELGALGSRQDELGALGSRQDELGALGSRQEAAKLLSSKLDLLKADLVSFQQQLQERHREEQSKPQPERHLVATLRRSSSVEETLSSPRNKLLRQSSQQQQKELEQGLSEQRELTHSIALQGSRVRLHSRHPEDHSHPSPCSAPPDDSDQDSSSNTWSRLRRRLLMLEENELLPPSEVTDSFTRCNDGTAGGAIGAQTLKELQALIRQLRELGRTAAESQVIKQAPILATSLEDPPAGAARQSLEEDLFHVLHVTSQILSSVNDLPLTAAGATGEDDGEQRLLLLQSLSAELEVLSSELACQGSKVSRVLGSDCVQQCLDDAIRVLSVIRAAATHREKQLRHLRDEIAEQQSVVQLQQQVEDQPHLSASLIHHTSQLQGELDWVVGGVGCHGNQVQSSVEVQQLFKQLVCSLEELLSLGSQRLAQGPIAELRDRAQLQQQHCTHTKFFQFLSRHFRILQYLTKKVPESALHRWEDVLKDLQGEVARLQQEGLEKGTRMQEIIQLWAQWEEDRTWSDSLLRRVETSFLMMHEEGDCGQQISETLSVYQELRGVLEGGRVRFSWLQEAGLWLQKAGFRGVGVSMGKLDAHWKDLKKKIEHEHASLARKWKLRSRFLSDAAALADWMGGAREMIDRWSQLSASEEVAADQWQEEYVQFVALTKDLEAKSGLKAAVVRAGSRLVQLNEADGASARNPEDLCSIQSRLTQMELDWSSLQSDVPVVRENLHKRWMEVLSQQGALRELRTWLGAAETQLEEHLDQTSSSSSDLNRRLKVCREIQSEMFSHQATLDHVNQQPQTCSTDDDHGGRCQLNLFSEEQGRVNQWWFRLQAELSCQVQEVQQELRSRGEREVRLQRIRSWITDQTRWLDLAQTPSSRAELRGSIEACQHLEEKIRQKCETLLELRDKRDVGGEMRCQTENLMQQCEDLKPQTDSVIQKLTEMQQLWDSVEKQLTQLTTKTIRTSQTLHLHHPQICLQAHRDLHQQLQLLHDVTSSWRSEWDQLSETASTLRRVISPAAAVVLAEHLDRQRDSWAALLAALEEQLQKSRLLLQVWEVYDLRAASLSQQLQTLRSEAELMLSGDPVGGDGVEQVTVLTQQVQSLLQTGDMLQSDLQGVLEASQDLIGQLEPSAASLVQSETRLLSRGVQEISRDLMGKLGLLQEELRRLQDFRDLLESLEEAAAGVWQEVEEQSDLLQPSGLSADLDVLNELSRDLSPGDSAARRLQRLNRCWAAAATRAEESCSARRTDALRRQTFQQKCESWMSFLQKMEDGLVVNIAGSYAGLRQQLRTHKRFQMELSVGHQILHSVIAEALLLLQKGEVEDRSDFILKLTHLREHWQGAVQRADQRRSLVEGLVKHWHLYRRSLGKLQRFLSDTHTLLPPAGPARCSLQQLRRSLQDLRRTELQFQRYQSTFVHTLEVGRQLFSMADEETQERLQADLGTLQEEWENLQSLLGRRMELTEATIEKWERCEAGLTDSMMRLKDVKTRLNQSMPESDDELQESNKENEDSLEDWAESLAELSAMKTDLSQYIIADDVLLLQEQVDHLHCQWEELCLKVSLRKQEVADRLNAWIIFNEKNKELCDWLTRMENKVAHNSDLNIEEMVEKLKKDCMEEINLFSENKTHLKQLGEQLITASNKTKGTEINDKLKDVNDRWQHLFDHIQARVRKLKETLVTVQQLDKNMSNLRTWLSRIEAELIKPVVYNVCRSDEIQRKLAEQQDLQRDIEQHTDSVASVLTLCDVLLHDADACGSDSENDSIQQTTQSLDRRWRNICAMSMERKMRIEETWRLWCKFLDDYSRFEDWLKSAELTAANPDSADVLYTSAKEELRKFEAFQRQVHERLTQLELVNKQYRRLARENRTDNACKLKVMVHEGNQRWDSLQKRVATILRRLKYFTSQREDFEGTREGILVWLTEMDLQLTNVEHFSESDMEDKMRQLNGFQQEITLNADKIDGLIVFGENLIQKSSPLDAVLIEDELEELHSYCQEVFGRVARFHHRLVNRRPVLDEEWELSDLDDSPRLTGGASWRQTRGRRGRRKEEEVEEEVSAGQQVMCHLLAPPLEHSGRETPVSVDSIPLEWDHTVDVGESSSHEDDEDATFFSALSDMRVTESLESLRRATIRAAIAASVKSVSDLTGWHHPGSLERNRVPREICQQGYVKLMSECSGSINSVKRVKLILNDDEELEDLGLTCSTADKQTSTGVIERWELLQAHKFAKTETDVKQDLEQWQKLNSDLCDVTSWLSRVLPELERLQRIAPSTSVRDLEVNVRKLKAMQKTFNSHKCLMISINLRSHHFLRGDSAEQRELREALGSANQSWTQACGALASWERRLHSALMQCQEFQETLHSLLMWLAEAENRLAAVSVCDLVTPRPVLMEHRDTLTVLQEELLCRQQQVSSLQEISSELLLEAAGDDSVEAKEKVHVIANKLQLLLRRVTSDLTVLHHRLENSWSESDRTDVEVLSSTPVQREVAAAVTQEHTTRGQRRDSSPHRPLLYRILRAAFPLHLVLLVLLVLVCLVPVAEEDYSCTLSNNFARSFYLMLRYTNGPPPT